MADRGCSGQCGLAAGRPVADFETEKLFTDRMSPFYGTRLV